MALSLSSLPLIGLLGKGKLNYGMMSIIIVTMMRLLSGMKTIKSARHRRQKKRQVYAHCLASIKMVGLVYARRREKRDRKILEVDYLIC